MEAASRVTTLYAGPSVRATRAFWRVEAIGEQPAFVQQRTCQELVEVLHRVQDVALSAKQWRSKPEK